jgi:hypothetical protein
MAMQLSLGGAARGWSLHPHQHKIENQWFIWRLLGKISRAKGAAVETFSKQLFSPVCSSRHCLTVTNPTRLRASGSS